MPVLHKANRALAGANLGNHKIARQGKELRHSRLRPPGEDFSVKAHAVNHRNFAFAQVSGRNDSLANGEEIANGDKGRTN